MKYTAEEVRDYADACRLAHKGPVIADMLTELAERIKVDESAAPVGFVMEATATRHKFGLLTQDLPPGAELFTHPPAQAAQVDRDAYEGAREDLLDWKGRAQRAEAALRSLGYAGVDSSQAPAWPAVVLDGAVEVLRKSLASDGHAVSIVFDSQEAADRFHTQMDEAMKVAQNTAAEPATHDEACKICGKNTPHHHLRGTAPTPTSPINLAAVREVIASHIEEAKKLRHDPESQDYLYEQADKLEAAIKAADKARGK